VEDNEAGCFIASSCTTLLSSCHAALLLCQLVVAWPLPNVTYRRHQTPLPPISIVHCCHCRHCCCRRAATTTTTATATTIVELTVVHCQRKCQQQHHHQHAKGSTNVKTFTNPDDLDLFNLSTVFEVCDVGRENLAISN
jgi:hypothetical protein